MKSYTDIEQSKKLAEILPLESADMCYLSEESLVPKVIYKGMAFFDSKEERLTNIIHCWSLGTLLGMLPNSIMLAKNIDSKYYSLNSDYMTELYDNPIDACYEMILKLNELKLL